MKTMAKQKSHSYDQSQLKAISDRLCNDIERLLEVLGITDYKNFDKMVTMSCPIHGGDNDSAFNLYHQGDHYRGNWKCRTHQCEEVFKSSILGFIRGCLSHNQHGWTSSNDTMCSFNETLEFVKEFLNQDISQIKVSKKAKEKISFVNSVRYINNDQIIESPKISKDFIKKKLDIPSTYFISRGFSKNILIKYDVGECLQPGKEMSGRAVVPIYDMNNEYMVGCTGRSINAKCSKCSSYHSSHDECPSNESGWLMSKWRHSAGFKTQEHLYNFWFAKKHIKNSHAVIVVESPGNVWRLEEAGIHNSVALFGSSMSDRQKMLLDISGAMTIIPIMDNDQAGQKATQQIMKKCEKTYNVKPINIQYEDIAAMTIDQVNQEIVPLIEKINL
jgi:5S rRNA maturation endonuclease (ribonuclease M5)